jgi:phospholipid/cholesterol/gamma-HCH transport system substrate-binding protein
MKFKIRFADQIVGLFILVAVVGVAAILIFIGINQRWFAKNYYFETRFTSGDGLSVGMPIMLKGFEIGKISRITLNPANEVDVQLYVEDTYYDKVRPNSVLELATSPIGLGSSMKFHAGKSRASPLAEHSFIPTLDSPEGKRLVEDGLVDIPKGEDVIGSVIAKINPLLDEAQSTIREFRRVAVTVDTGLSGRGGPLGTMVNDLSTTPGRVNRTVDDLDAKIGELMKKINVIADNLTDISVKANGVVGDLSGNLDVISQNLKDLTGDLKNTQGLVKRLLDPKGSIDTFLNDSNELYNQVDTALKNANAIIVQLKQFAEFVNNDTRPQVSGLLDKGNTTLDQVNDVLEAAKNNPLLKGGVPPRPVPATPMSSYRDEDF